MSRICAGRLAYSPWTIVVISLCLWYWITWTHFKRWFEYGFELGKLWTFPIGCISLNLFLVFRSWVSCIEFDESSSLVWSCCCCQTRGTVIYDSVFKPFIHWFGTHVDMPITCWSSCYLTLPDYVIIIRSYSNHAYRRMEYSDVC